MLGQTLDDAAGEALDKAARLLDLGFPGGPAIEREAADGDPEAFAFPVAMTNDPGLDFSFSGLKTALLYAVRDLGDEGAAGARADLAASFQAAVVDQLVAKLRAGAQPRRLAGGRPGGGVAANTPLRDRVAELCEDEGLRLKLVPRELCTDNAAMIASAAAVPRAAYPATSAGRLPRLGPHGGVRRSVDVFYGRPGCHLCDEAPRRSSALRGRASLRAARGRHRDATIACSRRISSGSRWSRWRASS